MATTRSSARSASAAMQRKEDPRFIRGQGHYVDDVKLPGMLHGAVLRSPLAHARIVSIDTSAAEAHPKVHAVITGADLEGLGLAWMPTLSADTQAVLATDKVRFQGQEVAFVVADDRYSARDALELIDVEYEPLPVGRSTPARRSTPTRRSSATTRRAAPTTTSSTGSPATRPRPTRSSRAPTSSSRAGHDLPALSTRRRWRPAARSPTWTPSSGKLTLWTTTQAPHAHRTVYALVAGLPEHKIRVISPDIGGGFGNKVADLPRLRAARSSARSSPASRSSGWRTAPRTSCRPAFARDYIMHGRDRRDAATARSSACASTCSPTTARSTRPRSRRSTRPASSTSSPAPTTSRPRTAR